jgi:D-alanyl-D-alanine endopeptidase (penicillin-binding protein 7)
MRRVALALCLLLACTAGRAELSFVSAHALVVDESTGEILLQKDEQTAAPMASLTKLMTAMVVLDARQDPDEVLRIEQADLDHLKRTHGGVPLGSRVSRGHLLELALIASDNHAAAALARHYPGGLEGFHEAVQRKIAALALTSTVIEEPTGLSPNNRASAQDVAKLLRAAAGYPEIAQITSQRGHAVVINGRRWTVHNTNSLVGTPGWKILLSKTGYTNEAGRCLSMRIEEAGRTVMVVLMGAMRSSERALDALNIRRWLAGEAPLAALPNERAQRKATVARRHEAAPALRPEHAPQGVLERSEPLAEPSSDAAPPEDAKVAS